MYLRATVPDDEFAREKQVVVEEIRMYADEPDSVAMENLQKALFPGHGLGCPVAGTPESLAPLEAEDLRRYIRSHYRADNTVVVVVGSFDDVRALDLVRRAFSTLKAPKKSMEGLLPPSFSLRSSRRPSQSHVSVVKES